MTQLYGGHIEVELPQEAIDVSEFRQIPDTQEVFLFEKPNGLDRSLIFDLLEKVDAASLVEVIAVHLDDILDGPPLFMAPLESFTHPKLDCEVHSFLVKPSPAKAESDAVKLYMFVVLIRLDSVGTDVVITMNVPVESGEITQDIFNKEVQSVTSGSTVLAECYKQLIAISASFNVLSWDLFV